MFSTLKVRVCFVRMSHIIVLTIKMCLSINGVCVFMFGNLMHPSRPVHMDHHLPVFDINQ